MCFEVSERPDATEEALKRNYGKPEVDPKDIEAKSKELFGLLCILTDGEANRNGKGPIRWIHSMGLTP